MGGDKSGPSTQSLRQVSKEEEVDGKESILIVDDDERMRRSLTAIFAKKDYQTETAKTGREAIEKAQERFFNAALLDIRLPDMEGIELLGPLKEMHPDMAVILATGHASLESAIEALNEGASGYLTKPLKVDEVLATIREALEKQRLVMENTRLLDALTKHQRDLQALSTQLINTQEAERKRISRELHDSLGQVLTAIRINLATMERELPAGLAPLVKERLADTSSLADQILEQVRELSLKLRPIMLDHVGLVPTLRWYVNRYSKRMGIEVELEATDSQERLTPEVETALYRIVQEALTNVARHAQAKKVRLHLERNKTKVCALIEDDGKGFDVEEVAARKPLERGVGLLGMRERVASLGGSLSIQSRPERGTRLSVEIALDRKGA